MTGAELAEAREKLGRMWGMGRRVSQHELTAVILSERSNINAWERAKDRLIPRNYALIITMMLDGARPRGLERELEL